MPSSSLSVVVQHLRAAAGRDGAGRTDGELLSQFLSRRDGDALAALVERHAPMVWGVCCRVLHNPQDAEDAFQATFLVLVQKAATVVPREMVANWLHGVARQTAVRLRATAAKRGWHEVQMDVMPEPAVVEARDEELLSRLDEELGRLPERSRALIVLCDLEGRTRKEVARQLGCPEGTVASGLVRARELLAKRLTRRGLAVSGGSLAATLSHSMASADVPASAVTSAINVATLLAAGKAAGAISGPVATLTQGVLKSMFLKKIMTTAVVALGLGVAVVTGGSLVMGQTEGPGKPTVGPDVRPPMEKPVDPAAKQEKDKEELTAWGKEIGGLQAGLGLPPGAKRVYRHGETVTLVVRVRNVGREAVKFQYLKQFLDETPPVVTDADGQAVAHGGTSVSGFHLPVDVSLEPGKEVVLETRLHGASGSPYKLLPAGGGGKAATKESPLLVGTGKFGLQYKAVFGNTTAGTITLDPALSKLATGRLELEVKEPEAVPPEKEGLTAWGTEVGGLQAGVAVVPGGERQYEPGDRVAFEVKLRNVGKEAVPITYGVPREHPPEIINSQGRQVRVTMPPIPLYFAVPTERVVKPGETMTLFKSEVAVGAESLEPRKGPDEPVSTPTIHVGPGTYKIAVGGMMRSHPKLSTGSVEFVVKKHELKIPDRPAEKPKPLTPEDAVRAAYDPKRAKEFNDTKPVVEFKVVVVTRADVVEVIEAAKDAVVEKGRGPKDVGLRSESPLDGNLVRFGVVLTAPAVRQLNRAGIRDLEKHFRGKTVRVTGTISHDNLRIFGKPSEVEIVVDDLNQLEVVN